VKNAFEIDIPTINIQSAAVLRLLQEAFIACLLGSKYGFLSSHAFAVMKASTVCRQNGTDF
jgi:hypothetical protein